MKNNAIFVNNDENLSKLPIFDISPDSIEVTVNDEDEEEFEEFTDEDATKKLYKYWKQYHLKEITDEQEKDINQLLEKLPTDYNEIENIIKTYLQKYVI